MRVALLLCFAQLFGAAWAQTGVDARRARQPAQVLQPQPRPATNPVMVTPKAETRATQPAAKRQPKTEALSEPRSVGDTIRRPGVTEDLRSVDTSRRIDPDLSARQSPVAARVDLDEPRAGAGADSQAVKSDSPATARVAVREQVDQTARIRTDANRLTERSFATPADLRTHRQAVSNIEKAAKVLETKAAGLPPSDLAIAQYQIDYATRQAAGVNRAAKGGLVVSNAQVQAVQSAAGPVQPMASRIMSGQRPFPVRKVSVRVGQKEGGDEVAGLQVYVLPGGILDDPSLFNESEIRSYLTRFSFTQLTSPAAQEVAVFDMRVWVGPRMNYDEMVRLVGEREVKKFRVINDPTVSNQLIELTFIAPDDLVEP
jgi:hypothetical protein